MHVVPVKSRAAAASWIAELTRLPQGDGLLGRLVLANAGLEQFEIVLDVGIAGILGLCLQQRLAGAPVVAPHVGLQRLTLDSDSADLRAFQTIRWTNGGDRDHAVPPIGDLRKELASTRSLYLLAWLDDEAAGTGVSHSLKGAGELVGIVTRADKRRRGVAATVTSHLVARHFSTGGDFAFLDAANEGAVRLYERIGFKTFGMNSVYR